MLGRSIGHAARRSRPLVVCRQATTASSAPDAAPPQSPLAARRVIFSGIQPTGIPHLGNYLGALKNWVHLQDSAGPDDKIYYAIVGLHAITVPQDAATLRKERQDCLAALLAIGLDPRKCTIFHQDQVPEHAELAWMLNCIAPVGRLNRMTTWKSRLATIRNANSTEEVDDSLLQLGLLAYPVLQAADVLLYQTTHVPVGEDQEQHLELTRDLAETFNKQHKQDLFVIPKTIQTSFPRVASLRNPAMKMSKSHPDSKTRISIIDSDEDITSKIKGAQTDSIADITENLDERPAVRNLIALYAGIADRPFENVVQEFAGQNAKALKERLAAMLVEKLGPIRQRYESIRKDDRLLLEVEELGAATARREAGKTLQSVKEALGLA